MNRCLNWKSLLVALLLTFGTVSIVFSIVGVPVLVMGQKGTFSVKPTLASAVAAADSANKTIWCLGYTPVSADLTVPSTRAIKVCFGGYIDVSSGKTLTISGPFDSGLHKAFAGSGTVAGLRYVEAVWFGTDTTATKAAFNAVADQGKIHFTSGSYGFAVSSAFTLSGKSFDTVMDNGAYLDATSATSNIASPAILDISGSVGTPYTLGANITVGASTATVNSTLAASLHEGDLVFVSTMISRGGNGELWDSSRSYYYKGEIVEVLSVSGTTVTIKDKFYDSYTAANTGTAKITPFVGTFTNFTMIGVKNHNQTGIAIRYSKGLRIVGGEVRGFDNSGVELAYAYDFIVDGLKSSNHGGDSLGLNYGLAISSSTKGVVANSNLIGGRHGLTLGGNEPNRFIRIANNFCGSESAWGSLDNHQNCQYIDIIGNHVVGGITIGGIDTAINGNTVTDGDVHYYPSSKTGSYLTISNNSITRANINIDNQLGPKTLDKLTIKGNTLESGTILVTSNTTSGSPLTANNCTIAGNNVSAGANNTSLSIVGYSGQPLTSSHLSIQGNVFNGGSVAPIYMNNVTASDVDISSTTSAGSGSYGLYVLNTTSNNLSLRDSKIVGDFSSRMMLLTTNTIPTIIIDRNYIKRIATGTIYSQVDGSDYIQFTNNFVDGITVYGGSKLTATDIFYADNRLINTSGAANLIGRYFDQMLDGGLVRTTGTAAPSTGTWKVGDYCRKTNPSAGQPKGWYCTVAGTPGTWVSEGNL